MVDIFTATFEQSSVDHLIAVAVNTLLGLALCNLRFPFLKAIVRLSLRSLLNFSSKFVENYRKETGRN
jgi:hypothetical protein